MNHEQRMSSFTIAASSDLQFVQHAFRPIDDSEEAHVVFSVLLVGKVIIMSGIELCVHHSFSPQRECA